MSDSFISSMLTLTSKQSLLGFAAWTGLHALGIVSFRSLYILQGAKITSFPSGKEHGGSALYQRLRRSHVNCIENLPLFAAVVLVNLLAGGPSIDLLARLYLFARVGQSVTHCTSTSGPAIYLRFTFYSTQLIALGLMLFKTWASAGAA